MEIIGRQIEVGLGLEETRGTAQTVAEKWYKKLNATIVQKVEKKVDESTRNRLEDSLGARIVKKWFEGDLEGNLHADAIGYVLYNLYGSETPVLVGSGVYDHTFAMVNGIQHGSLSIFAKDGSNSQEVFSNGMVSTLELTANVDDYVKFKTSFMAKAASANSDTPSYDTEYDFVGKEITVKMADSEAGLSGATAIPLKELSLTWDTGLIRDHIVGAYEPDDLYNAKMMIEGEFTLNYADDTYKDLFASEDYKYLQIVIEGDALIGSTYHPTITILLNRVQVMDWNRDGGADELVAQPISFKAFYNETDGEQSTIVLRNLTTEYGTPISA